MKRIDKGMNEKYYIHLEPLSSDSYMYGVLSIVDNTPFDYSVSELVGKREEVLDTVAKKIIATNSTLLDRNIFNLKFSELTDTKYMIHHIQKDDFYKDYRVNITPAVFLSDMNKVSAIKVMVQKNILNRRLFENWKNNQKD